MITPTQNILLLEEFVRNNSIDRHVAQRLQEYHSFLHADASSIPVLVDNLRDEKRRFLFINSPFAETYCDLLIHRAQGTLPQFRAQYNRLAPTQPVYCGDHKLTFNLSANVLKDPREFIRPKLELLLAKIRTLNSRLPDLESKIKDLQESVIQADCIPCQDEVEPYDFDDSVEISAELRRQQHELRIPDLIQNELDALRGQVIAGPDDQYLSGKVRGRECVLSYSLSVSPKDPLDVRFGNDGGCCIGVYPASGNIGNAYGLPHNIADNACYILQIDQQINGGKKRRTGIVFAFAADDSRERLVLVGNSLELSSVMNPPEHIPPLSRFVEEEVISFCRANGFVAAAMGNHDYNTSVDHSTHRNDLTQEAFMKLVSRNERNTYSEVFTPALVTQEGYMLFDDRRKK